MKEALVRSEFDHSCLLLEEAGPDVGYKLKMLTQNKIPGLLECRIRYIEEKSYCSYDITSKRSLEQEYTDKKMQFQDLMNLFYGINKSMCSSNEYLLEHSDFWLQPQYIFKNLETEELECLYYPQKQEEKRVRQEIYRSLADFLLDKIDHKDEHAVNIAYHFYKLSKEEYFSFESFVNFIEKEALMMQAEERKEKQLKMAVPSVSREDVVLNTEEDLDYDRISAEEKALIKWWILGVMFFMGVLLTTGYFLIPIFRKYAMVALVPGLLIIISAIILLIRNVVLQIKKEREGLYEEPKEPVRIEEYFDDAVDDVTVFFNQEEYFHLKWKEGHFSKEYALEAFPVTVGKLKESVQIVINDASISRLHARLRKQGNMLYLQDLDSTNGTFVNGKRLLTGEEAIIKRGDEIQFGKIIVNVV